MPQWGASTSNESKPKDRWLAKGRGDKLANVFATGQGWAMRWKWGTEILVGLGGLNVLLGVPTHVDTDLVTLIVQNTSPSNVAFRLIFNEGVTVNGSPTLVAISSNVTHVANVSLIYNAALSDPTRGKLVFANGTFNAGNAAAVSNGVTLTVNSTSTFQGQLVLAADDGSPVSNTIAIANSVAFTQ